MDESETVAVAETIAPVATPKIRTVKKVKPKEILPAHYRGQAEAFARKNRLTPAVVAAKVLKHLGSDKPRKAVRVVRLKRGKDVLSVPVVEVGRALGMWAYSDVDAPKNAMRFWIGDIRRMLERIGCNVVDMKEEAKAAAKRKRTKKQTKATPRKRIQKAPQATPAPALEPEAA